MDNKFLEWYETLEDDEVVGEELAEIAFEAGYSYGKGSEDDNGKYDFMREQREDIDKLKSSVKFLLSFAPKDCPKGLSPTFYNTLTYDGDKKLQDRIDRIKYELGLS